jgi:large subunit ribosomal protein L3
MLKEKLEGEKIEMAQLFLDDGTVVPVTYIWVYGTPEIQLGEKIGVTGRSKGKGFAGVIKRHGFSGGPKTHGQKDKMRSPGSIGAGTDPGRVWPGQKMPGRMGAARTTVKNLEVVEVQAADDSKIKVALKGAVPGHRHTRLVLVRLTKDLNKEEDNAS